jgi:hypothetical protein
VNGNRAVRKIPTRTSTLLPKARTSCCLQGSWRVQQIPADMHRFQEQMVFSVVRWASFSQLLLAFACVYQSMRMQKLVSQDSRLAKMLDVHIPSANDHTAADLQRLVQAQVQRLHAQQFTAHPEVRVPMLSPHCCPTAPVCTVSNFMWCV